MYHMTVVHVSAIKPANYHAQDVGRACPHPAHQERTSLAHLGVETIYPRRLRTSLKRYRTGAAPSALCTRY